ncbi:MAG: tetratricopeptide repeat protein [Gammaproteobacteria bacterium]|nr:tetratricopeptide repeat protein [Gammaproteobacteria bacterium]
MRKTIILLLALAINGAALAPLHADGGSTNRSSRLGPIQQLIDDEDYQGAIAALEEALAESSDDADLLNLLAYSHRKSMHFEIALDYYRKALQIDPEHRGANEYLGELYLQMNRPDLALERLEVLDADCFFGCDEYDELKEAIEDYRVQNPS